MVFLAIIAVARMVILETRKKGLYDGSNFSHRDLILFFRHQLRVKIRCCRKRLDRIAFDRRWVNAASLVVPKGATLESSFPPLPVHGDDGLGPSGPHPRFTNSPGDLGSIPGRVIPKTEKWYLMLPCLEQHYKVRIKGSGAIQGKE